jgi:uncharacterized protein involved in exopolysaccharide biosynthesis
MSEHVNLQPEPADLSRSAGKPRAAAARSYGQTTFESRELHLVDYVKVLYKRRHVAGVSFLLVFLSGVVYTFTATPIYQARVQLLIEAESQNVVSFKEVIEQDKATNDYYQTQYRILQSRSLARRTLSELKLWEVLDPSKAPETTTVRGLVYATAGWFGAAKAIEPRAADETSAQAATIDRF